VIVIASSANRHLLSFFLVPSTLFIYVLCRTFAHSNIKVSLCVWTWTLTNSAAHFTEWIQLYAKIAIVIHKRELYMLEQSLSFNFIIFRSEQKERLLLCGTTYLSLCLCSSSRAFCCVPGSLFIVMSHWCKCTVAIFIMRARPSFASLHVYSHCPGFCYY
jgi:hypothetical protein